MLIVAGSKGPIKFEFFYENSVFITVSLDQFLLTFCRQ